MRETQRGQKEEESEREGEKKKGKERETLKRDRAGGGERERERKQLPSLLWLNSSGGSRTVSRSEGSEFITSHQTESLWGGVLSEFWSPLHMTVLFSELTEGRAETQLPLLIMAFRWRAVMLRFASCC